MLTKREGEVMRAVAELCKSDGRCLVLPSEILRLMPKRENWTDEGLDSTLTSLASDGYFDLLSSERKGEKMYVITLTSKGASIEREHKKERRALLFKFAWTVVSAIIAFLVGVILKEIF